MRKLFCLLTALALFAALLPISAVGASGGTYTMPDMTLGSANKCAVLPTELVGDYEITFTYSTTNVDNNWIYLNDSDGMFNEGVAFGRGDISDGTGSTAINARGGSDSGDLALGTVTAGHSYGVVIKGNAAGGTYDIKITDKAAGNTVADKTGVCERSASTKSTISYIQAGANGQAGRFTLTDITVYDAEAESVDYTVTVTGAGDNDKTYTENAIDAHRVTIPDFTDDGYILKSLTADGTSVTLMYEELVTNTLGTWAIRNNVTDDTWISQIKFLGSHDAFADTDSVTKNEGGDLYGDTGASSSGSLVINNSRAQSEGVLAQLNAGVRYFDIRLSRQSDGSFWTVHGPAFESFREIAKTIAQFAKANPGEVIILDFQSTRDALYTSDEVVSGDTTYYGDKAGDDNKEVYQALATLLAQTGVLDYAPENADWDKKYGTLTNGGEKASILLIAKARGASSVPDVFANRSSVIKGTYDSDISSYSDVVSNIDGKYSSLSSGAALGVIHAYTTVDALDSLFSGNSLLKEAQTNNYRWIEEENFENWMGWNSGDVLLLNDSVTNAESYLKKLSEYNRDGVATGEGNRGYSASSNGVSVTGETASVPFSTVFGAEVKNASGTAVLGGESYDLLKEYDLSLIQYDSSEVSLTGEVTLTIPGAMTENGKKNVLLKKTGEGYAYVTESDSGDALTATVDALGTYFAATLSDVPTETTITCSGGTARITSGESVTGYLVQAVYDGGVLSEIAVSPLLTVTADTPAEVGDVKVGAKLMFIKDFESLKPLAAVITAE